MKKIWYNRNKNRPIKQNKYLGQNPPPNGGWGNQEAVIIFEKSKEIGYPEKKSPGKGNFAILSHF